MIMKNKIILGAMLMVACAFSMEVNAQLEVTSNGNVKAAKIAAIGTDIDNYVALNIHKIGPYSKTTTYGIKSIVEMPTYINYTLCGVYGEADARNTMSVQDPHPIVGVYGTAKTSQNLALFTAGVAGLAHWRGGIGVYGGVNSPMCALPLGTIYAGYFNGTVKVNGTLMATAVSTTSDLSQKENIQQIPLSLAEKIHMLNPVSYTLKQDSMWKYEKEATELQGTHYGLLAQEVQKIFPELVYERGDQLSINYIELIPLLIMKVQELSAEVNTLKDANKAKKITAGDKNSNDEVLEAILYQNNPNPFSVDTKIKYQLPPSTQSATLYVYDMNGSQMAEYPISIFGEGSIIVYAGALDAGMYLYSLIADGQVVDTKRMILTK